MYLDSIDRSIAEKNLELLTSLGLVADGNGRLFNGNTEQGRAVREANAKKGIADQLLIDALGSTVKMYPDIKGRVSAIPPETATLQKVDECAKSTKPPVQPRVKSSAPDGTLIEIRGKSLRKLAAGGRVIISTPIQSKDILSDIIIEGDYIIAWGRRTGAIEVWDFKTGEFLWKADGKSELYVNSLSVVEDRLILITNNIMLKLSPQIYVFDMKTGIAHEPLDFSGYISTLLVKDDKLYVYQSVYKGKKVLKTIETIEILDLSYTNYGSQLGMLKVEKRPPHGCPPVCMDGSDRGKLAIAGDRLYCLTNEENKSAIQVFDLKEERFLHFLGGNEECIPRFLKAIEIDKSGRVYAADYSGHLCIWDQDGKEIDEKEFDSLAVALIDVTDPSKVILRASPVKGICKEVIIEL